MRSDVTTEPREFHPAVEGGGRQGHPVLSFMAIWAVLWSLAALWALATPRYASPDEPAHARKAAATVRGELIGKHVPGGEFYARTFELPGMYAGGDPDCFAFKPMQTASCQRFPVTPGTQRLVSSASWYPPLYYAWTGLPSLVSNSAKVLYAMRLWSGLACSFFLTCGLWMLRHTDAPLFLSIGAALGITPTVLYFSGMINPNSLEIVCAFALWIGGTIIFSRQTRVPTSVVAMTTAAASVMILMRTLSWLWFAVVLVILGVAHGVGGVRRFLRSRPGRFSAGTCAVSLAMQFGWLLKYHLFSVSDKNFAVNDAHSKILLDSAGEFQRLWQEMIGVFGWVDTASPALTYVLWLVGLGLVVGAAILFGSHRVNLAVFLLAATVVLLPIILDYRQAQLQGHVWQGRYTLPIAVGLPVVAALIRSPEWVARQAQHRYRLAVAGALVIAQVGAFYWALRRYTVGLGNPPLLLGHQAWGPPGGAVLLIGAYCVASGAFCWLFMSAGRLGLSPPARPAAVSPEPDTLAEMSRPRAPVAAHP